MEVYGGHGISCTASEARLHAVSMDPWTPFGHHNNSVHATASLCKSRPTYRNTDHSKQNITNNMKIHRMQKLKFLDHTNKFLIYGMPSMNEEMEEQDDHYHWYFEYLYNGITCWHLELCIYGLVGDILLHYYYI